MYDLTHVDLESLITADLGPPARRAGGQPFWHCPFHKNGGRQESTPSLDITPDQQHFKCFGCAARGDAVDWLMRRRELSRPEALRELGVKPGRGHAARKRSAQQRPPLAPLRSMPDAAWQESARQVVAESAQGLWATDSADFLAWLQDRGLGTEALSRHRLGYNAEEGAIGTLHVPQGIVIPWTSSKGIWRISVRQIGQEPKYKNIAGSVLGYLYLPEALQVGRPTLITEGEFDALLAMQHAGDLVNVTTLGSANTHPNLDAIKRLLVSPLILVGFDPDAAGGGGAEYWRQLSQRVRVVKVPGGGDVTDFYQQGGSIRDWVQFELARLGWRPLKLSRDAITSHKPLNAQPIPNTKGKEKMASEQTVGYAPDICVTARPMPWPSVCLAREQELGSRSARLFPLIGKTAWTPQGPGRLVDFKEQALVAFQDNPESTVSIPIHEVLPVAPESIGMTFEEARNVCWQEPQPEVAAEPVHSPEALQSIRDRIRAAVQRVNELEAKGMELALDENCQVRWTPVVK